ncbi:MAG: hypothetical protein ABFD16_10175 [Thermoguttaceae bacterium]
MVCSACGEWKEYDHKAFITMFVEGLPPDSPEAQERLKNRQEVMPFIEKHLAHCREQGGGIKFIEEGEAAFRRLDPKKEEK